MKRITALLTITLAVTIILYSCGGGGGGGGVSTGTVGLYATDDVSDFKQVNVTLDSVSLLNTGTNATCDLSTTSTPLNLSDLSSTIQLLSVSSCPAAQFNRIHVVFENTLTLMDASDATSSCTFTSFNYNDKNNQPDVITCPSGSNTCTLDINGAVNVLASQPGKLALDFTLKDFVVNNFPGPNCTATMKVSPLDASAISRKGSNEAVTGTISNLNTTTKTFTLTKGNTSFTVNYSNVTQTGIDQLLQFAQNNSLRVQVKASSIDLSTNTIIASAIFVKADGTISGLTATTFTLNGTPFTSINVDYSGAEVEGTLADGTAVEVKLSGFDGANYLAFEVEIELAPGMED